MYIIICHNYDTHNYIHKSDVGLVHNVNLPISEEAIP
jgi:hypothetical protein